MKNPISQTKKINTIFNTNKPGSAIRDDLDNRKNEGQGFKGDDITQQKGA